MNDQAKAPSILRESPVVVFVNSVAGGGPGTFLSGTDPETIRIVHVHAQFAMTNSAAELESSAQNAFARTARGFLRWVATERFRR